MPSKTITPEEKGKVTAALPPPSKILAAVPARIYFAHPRPDKWSYGGLQGVLAFTYDTSKEVFFLKLVDFLGTRGVIWSHELYDQFEYNKDRPFFHSFAGDECMIGVVFAAEKDATLFFKKVTTRKADKATKVSPEPKKSKKGGKVDKSMISGPQVGSFRHVAHVGYDEENGFTSNNVDESWLSLVRDLQKQGFTAEVLEKNKDFIQNFVRDAKQGTGEMGTASAAPKKKPPPPPAPRRGAHVASSSVTSTNGDSAHPTPQAPSRQPPRSSLPAPPLPPQRGPAPPSPPVLPPAPARPNIPPPPPSRPANSPSIPPPPPPVVRPTPPTPAPPLRPPNGAPPPPSARPQNGTPPPPPPPPPLPPVVSPPPPVRPQNGAPPPPAPPSLPPSRAGGPPSAPPVPPPVEEDSVSPPPAPPPPPPPVVAASMPSPQPGRADLLASIRGQSVANLRKTPAPSPNPPPAPAPAAEEPSNSDGTGGGGDLTAALAAALLQRNKKLGDSDDEDDDDDEWD